MLIILPNQKILMLTHPKSSYNWYETMEIWTLWYSTKDVINSSENLRIESVCVECVTEREGGGGTCMYDAWNPLENNNRG